MGLMENKTIEISFTNYLHFIKPLCCLYSVKIGMNILFPLNLSNFYFLC